MCDQIKEIYKNKIILNDAIRHYMFLSYEGKLWQVDVMPRTSFRVTC